MFSNVGLSKNLKDEDDLEEESEQVDKAQNSIRHKDETKEERKLRKQEVKTDRKVNCTLRKFSDKLAFCSGKNYKKIGENR